MSPQGVVYAVMEDYLETLTEFEASFSTVKDSVIIFFNCDGQTALYVRIAVIKRLGQLVKYRFIVLIVIIRCLSSRVPYSSIRISL